MNYYQLVLMPLVGAFIGWGTNLLAIRMLFEPINPFRIPILGWEIQGLIPKRRYDLSQNIGQTLEKEILSSDDIINKLASNKIKGQVIIYIKKLVIERFYEKMPSIIPPTFRSAISEYLGEVIERHGSGIFDEIKTTLMEKAREEIDLKKMVEDKLNSLDIKELEGLIINLSKRELKQIEVLGAVLGFLVGVIQAGISCLL